MPKGASSLRWHLLRVVLVSLAPLLVFSSGLVALLALEQRNTFRQGARERTLALLTAVDTELNRSIAALEALAASATLRAESLGAFRAEAERALKSRPEWLTLELVEPSGRRRVSFLENERGDASSDGAEGDAHLLDVVKSAEPSIGSLFREPLTKELVFAVRVPVETNGSVDYVLTALVRPTSFSEILASQGLPPRWVGVILDGSHTIVARTVSPEKTVGKPASESLQAALSRVNQGWFQGTTVEGWDVYTPFNRSDITQWTVAMGIPAAEVLAPFRRSLLYLASFGLGSLTLGIVLAWLLSRRSAQSIEELATKAEDLSSGTNVSFVGLARFSGIAEVEDLKSAFGSAARTILARAEERDRVEASLREAQAALREADRRKDQFIAMLGHELRNPLGILSNAVQLLRMKPPSDRDLSELREMMERQVIDMTELMDDLLDASRIAQGRIQMNPTPCDLVTIVRESLADQRSSLDAAGLELEVELPDHPLWMMGDRTRLAQALANLLNNARKFTNRGGKISVRLVEKPDGEKAEISIRDTGVGMEPETLRNAFEPFSQADRTIDRSRGGLGLGLALVKGLIELHDGEVRAESEGLGRGAEFIIQLPLEPAILPPRIDAVPPSYPGRPLKILVVEDNRMAARTLQMFLDDRGHEVEVAHSGRGGIEAALRFRPDVVLCDIGLPEVDGYTVARALREEPELRDVSLVAVTGYGQSVDRVKAREAGFDEHLTKPVDLNELHEILAARDPDAIGHPTV